MRRITAASVSAIILTAGLAITASAAGTETISYTYDAGRWETQTREMEKLGRGLVAIKSGNSVYLSWRLLDSEDARFGSAESNVSFNVYRGNSLIATVENSTNYTDTSAGVSYSVAPVTDGVEGEKCTEVSVQNGNYFDIKLTKPADETVEYVYPYTDSDGNTSTEATFSFFPADCSTGDLDGDGEYEIIVKWTSSERDVGSPGTPEYSGTVRFAAYKLNGTKLWENDINLGKNVYSSAHTVQFLVYDFDGDGKAEMICQTSLGSKDAKGVYVSHAADPVTNQDIYNLTDDENAEADYRGGGRITVGEEFLTVFNGETGEAMDTIELPTSRGDGNGIDYGDNFGNRSNRFMSSVAYLDGERPYAVYSRGYYFAKNAGDVYADRQRTSIAGISFENGRLNAKYRFDTNINYPGSFDGSQKYAGNGNHNCTVADVNGDGKDEYIIGALCVGVDDEDRLRPRWCTFMEHGDALHIGDYDPTHTGFEFFTVHEDSGPNYYTGTEIGFGMSVIDADTGDILFHETASADTGRGVMANIGMGGYYQIWSAKNDNLYKANGGTSYTAGSKNGLSQNFRIFWDGDLYDELLDGTKITSYNTNGSWWSPVDTIFTADGCVQINGTKANPALQADLFGDWREEVVYPTSDGNYLRVFTTTTPTDYKIKTLMHDPVYRSGVAAEQTAYNQPPHVGIYLAADVFEAKATSISITQLPEKTKYVIGEELDVSGMVVMANREDGTTTEAVSYKVSELDSSEPGEKTITVTYEGLTAEFKVEVMSVTGISVTPPSKTTYAVGQSLNTTGVTVTATYSDGSTGEVSLSDCTVSGFSSAAVGECTVTVTYLGKSDKFTVTITEAGILLLNGTYETDSVTTVATDIPIGSYRDSFTLEHSVTINQMPANGNGDKRSVDGFFLRFMADNHTGGGWYLTQNGTSRANVVWKNTSTNTVGTINIGETYTFRYTFLEVGTGNGAKVTLTILDANGNKIAEAIDQNLRNFSDTNTGRTSPIKTVQINNQANYGETSSIAINNAKIYGTGTVTVDGREITLDLNGIGNAKIFAAKYSEGMLSDVQEITPSAIGETTYTADFEPDKVFMWTYDMYPIDVWSK